MVEATHLAGLRYHVSADLMSPEPPRARTREVWEFP